jgi:polysaccharide export outer membrane protein
MSPSRSLNAVAALALLGACATGGTSTPVNDYQEPPEAPQSGYTIQSGDVLQVRVFNQPDMSTRVRVRDDGKVSIPFLNDVTAVGMAPNALAQQIQTRLKEFINAPVVTISLEETRPFSISVIGR